MEMKTTIKHAMFFLIGYVAIGLLVSFTSTGKKEKNVENKLTKQERKDGWILMFDGKTLNGWRGLQSKPISKNWVVKDNAIQVGGPIPDNSSDILFDKKFMNFDLKFEWRVAKGGNSGVYYLAQELHPTSLVPGSVEYQILDNISYPTNGALHASASLYDMVAAEPQNAKPTNEWNTGEIIVNNGEVIHKQNGVVVVKCRLWTKEWEDLVNSSKFKGTDAIINLGGKNHEGYIGLQVHGGTEKDDYVWFKNMKIKVL